MEIILTFIVNNEQRKTKDNDDEESLSFGILYELRTKTDHLKIASILAGIEFGC